MYGRPLAPTVAAMAPTNEFSPRKNIFDVLLSIKLKIPLKTRCFWRGRRGGRKPISAQCFQMDWKWIEKVVKFEKVWAVSRSLKIRKVWANFNIRKTPGIAFSSHAFFKYSKFAIIDFSKFSIYQTFQVFQMFLTFFAKFERFGPVDSFFTPFNGGVSLGVCGREPPRRMYV